jgi:hypothetical protein
MSEGSNAEEVAPNRSNAQRERKPVIPFVSKQDCVRENCLTAAPG